MNSLYIMEVNNPKIKENPKTLMNLAKQGDKTAFGKLYELYFTPVFRYIYFRIRNKKEAEDLSQIVFLKVFESISKFENIGKPPLAFFFTVARNTIIDFWRKNQGRTISESEMDEGVFANIADTGNTPEDLIQKKQTKEKMFQTISNLTSEQQDVVILKFINDFSNQEVAKMLGKTEPAVRQVQSRALKMIREQLKNWR